jgi:transposase-like protein
MPHRRKAINEEVSVVVWRLRYKLSLRDVAEMFLERGWSFTHEAVRDWEMRFASLITQQLRAKRRGQVGKSWYVDETYIKVHGKWCYLYRAIDHDGNLVDSRLSKKRDMDAAKQCFEQAVEQHPACHELNILHTWDNFVIHHLQSIQDSNLVVIPHNSF